MEERKSMIYEFIRKHFPEILGFVNKKKYRAKKSARKERDARDLKATCNHIKGYLFDDCGNGFLIGHCPTCSEDFFVKKNILD
jgi:hypothetical protein